jgi:spore cortex formation protein SpoVR/YcgB (stage V sporulation)
MTKPKSANALQAVLDRQVRDVAPSPAAAVSSPVPAPRARAKRVPEAAGAERSNSYRPSREGKRFIGGYFEPKVAKQLKLLAAEDDTTVQDLVEEALDLLFVKKGKGSIVRGNA